MILFLDFDGVLHPTWQPSPREGYWLPYNGPMFASAHALAEILRPYRDQIDIVISSTWGASRSLDALKALLPAEVAERVTDAVHHRLPPLETSPGEVKSTRATRRSPTTCGPSVPATPTIGWPWTMMTMAGPQNSVTT